MAESVQTIRHPRLSRMSEDKVVAYPRESTPENKTLQALQMPQERAALACGPPARHKTKTS